MTDKHKEPSNIQPSLADLITLREAAELSKLSQSHIRLLVRQGELWGLKLGRNWFTTANAVMEYLNRNRKPGAKPKKIT